jgi:hypothetical protein
MLLAYDQDSLPGRSAAGRIELARSAGLRLEVANRGRGIDPERYRRAGVEVVTVQAWAMHRAHPLHRDPRRRLDAVRHVHRTMELAARLGARRVVTACGFGHDLADRPRERARDFFAGLAPRARDLGVKILIEPLSPLKAAALTDPGEVGRLVDELAEPALFGLVLDTGHLADGGFDVERFLAGWGRPVDELQLRGPLGEPPDPALPLARWLEALPAPPGVLCVEHRRPIRLGAWRELVAAIRAQIAGTASSA